jgi:hypothetical protein
MACGKSIIYAVLKSMSSWEISSQQGRALKPIRNFILPLSPPFEGMLPPFDLHHLCPKGKGNSIPLFHLASPLPFPSTFPKEGEEEADAIVVPCSTPHLWHQHASSPKVFTKGYLYTHH